MSQEQTEVSPAVVVQSAVRPEDEVSGFLYHLLGPNDYEEAPIILSDLKRLKVISWRAAYRGSTLYRVLRTPENLGPLPVTRKGEPALGSLGKPLTPMTHGLLAQLVPRGPWVVIYGGESAAPEAPNGEAE